MADWGLEIEGLGASDQLTSDNLFILLRSLLYGTAFDLLKERWQVLADLHQENPSNQTCPVCRY